MPPAKRSQDIDTEELLSSDDESKTNTKKRLTFKDEDDLILLRQVHADRPWAAAYGKLSSSWQEVADKCCTLELFSWCEVGLKGHTARKRFDVLIASLDYDEHVSQASH
jgi:hypothetical protein